MATCGSCGASGGGRFCSRCGAAFPSTTGGPRILGTGAPSTGTSGALRPQRRTILLTAATIVVVGVLAGTLFGALGDDRSAGTAREADQATTVPGYPVPPPSADPEGGAAPSTTGPPPFSTVETDNDRWLGEPAGWYLLVRAVEGLQRIDLDTGEVVDMGTELFPLAYTGEYVVLRNQTGELVALHPPALTGEPSTAAIAPTTTGQYPSRSRLTVSDDPGRAWIHPTDGRLGGIEIDLHTGRELRRVTDVGGPDSWSLSSPQFISPLSGGIYRLGNDNVYHRIRDGSVVAEGHGRMLISECSDRLDCRYTWLDASTLDPLPDLAVPDAFAPFFPLLLANGRVISDGGAGFIDVETGESRTVLAQETSGLIDGWAQFSPDARFIAYVNNGAVSIRGLLTRVTQRPALRAPSRVIPVFIPKPAPVSTDAR